MADLDDLVDDLQPDRDTVTIVVSRAAAETVAAREGDVQQRRGEVAGAERVEDGLLEQPRTAAAREALAAAETALQAAVDAASGATRTFTFESIGMTAWRELERKHPPTPAQRKDGLGWNADTFPVAAVAASLVDPAGSPAAVEKLAAKLSMAQWMRLWRTCLRVNAGDADVPLSLSGSGSTGTTGTN